MMTLRQIYETAIEMGKEADPRGKEGVQKVLARRKKSYEELPAKKKKDFDLETLTNPYSDTRVLFGDSSIEVDKVLCGIDIEPAEILLADNLNAKGEGIDAVIAHHPLGAGYAALHEVMELQADMVASYGVPINIAEGVMRDRIAEVSRTIAPRNHFQTVDAARLLRMPLLCVHTPADNLCFKFLKELMEKKNPEYVGDVLEILKEVPEYLEAVKNKTGPVIFAGDEKNHCGRVVPAEITGGTEGAKEMYEKMANAGVGTIIGMHASEEHRKECQKYHINMVIAGHMASDSVGLNRFFDALEKRGVEVLSCSGLIRK